LLSRREIFHLKLTYFKEVIKAQATSRMAANGGRNNGGGRGGKVKVFPPYKLKFMGLKALTEDEAEQYEFEGPRAGADRCSGVGIVRVEGTKDVNWVVIRLMDLPHKYCSEHIDVQMGLLKTSHSTPYHLEEAVFYKCKVNISGDDDNPIECGCNYYVMFDRAEAQQQIAADPNVVLLVWKSKMDNP
jgi:hypothetical protein